MKRRIPGWGFTRKEWKAGRLFCMRNGTPDWCDDNRMIYVPTIPRNESGEVRGALK